MVGTETTLQEVRTIHIITMEVTETVPIQIKTEVEETTRIPTTRTGIQGTAIPTTMTQEGD